MMKDRLIKEKLLKYFLKRFWYSNIEVTIFSKKRISSTKKLITDVDVLGLHSDVSGQYKKILGDCKTLKNQSPIARVLWMKGLMSYLDSSKGFIVLDKGIEREHQLTASILDIQLLSDSEFETFGNSTTDETIKLDSAVGNMANWDTFFNIDKKYPPLASLIEFSKSDFWNQDSSSYQLRTAIAMIRLNKGEFNPAVKLHQAALLNHISLVAIALNNIILQIFNQYLVPASKAELDRDLKIIIYGGIENYEFLNELRKKFGNGVAEKDLELPEWDKFLELVRLVLENPLGFADVPLFLKEHAFELLSPDKHTFKNSIRDKNKYAVLFSYRIVEYCVKAAGLPKDFNEVYTEKILNTAAYT